MYRVAPASRQRHSHTAALRAGPGTARVSRSIYQGIYTSIAARESKGIAYPTPGTYQMVADRSILVLAGRLCLLGSGAIVQAQGDEYYLSPNSMHWDQCDAFCTSIDAEFACIGSQAENDAIYEAFHGDCPQDATECGAWFGLTDAGSEGNWVSTCDGEEPWSPLNWSPGEPNGGAGENCANIWGPNGRDRAWNDYGCSSTMMPCACKYVGQRPPRPHGDHNPGACIENGGSDNDCCACPGTGGCSAGYSWTYMSWDLCYDGCDAHSSCCCPGELQRP